MIEKDNNNQVVPQPSDQVVDMTKVDYLIFNKNFLKNKLHNIVEANKRAPILFLSTKVVDTTKVDYLIFNKNFLKNKVYNIVEANRRVPTLLLTTEQDYKTKKKAKAKERKLAKQSAKKKRSFKRRLLNKCIFALCAIITGVGLGSWYYSNVLSSSLDWNTYLQQLSEYESRQDETLGSAFDKILGDNYSQQDMENFETIASEKGITPQDLSLAENYQLANYNFENASQYIIQGTGQIRTIATQSIYSEKKYDGNTYQSISISNGLMKIAEIAQMNKNQTSVTTIKGQITSNQSADWNGERNTYLPTNYKNLTGGLPNTSQNFIIAEQTVSNSLDGEIEIIENEDGSKYYQFTMVLDPIYSVLNYINQIKYTSNLSSYPEFSSITQVVTIDENWNFVSICSTEIYSIVAFGMKNSCTGTLDNYFYFDQDVLIEVL